MTFKNYWIQTFELTIASIKSRYRKTLAGFIWVILNPLLLFGVQSLVFKKFLKLQIPDYYLFLLGGLLPWIFFTSTVQMGTPVFVSQSELLRSFKISPWVIISAQVLDGFINFLATLLLIFLPVYYLFEKNLLFLGLIPLALLPLLIGTLSITITLSLLNVFYRDINFIMGFVFNLLFFITPIFYPKEFIPTEYQWLTSINPVLLFIDPFRSIIYTQDFNELSYSLIKSFISCIIFTIVALLVWRRKRNDFYRYL